MPEVKQLMVTINRIKYPNEELDREKRAQGENNLFYVLETYCSNGMNIICKGEMRNRPQVNQRFRFTGNDIVWNGQRQFSFKEAEIVIPVDERDLLSYACNLTNGFGPALEEKIWEKKGENWRDLSMEDGIRGITDGKINAFRLTIDTLKYQKIQTQVMAYMIGLGCTRNMANTAWETWGSETITRIEGNVYDLCELPNYGFDDADKLRTRFEIGDNDPRRLKAAVMYCMRLLTESGNNIIQWYALEEEIKKKLPTVSCKTYCEQVGKMMGYELQGWANEGKISLMQDYLDEIRIFNYIEGGN